MGQVLRGVTDLYYIYLHLTDSFHGMHDAINSRIGVLFLVGIQWVRLPVVWTFFLENYGYVFQTAVQNFLYQHAR